MVGIFEADPKLLNPTRDQLRAYIGGEAKDDEKEFEYVGDDKDKNTRVTLSFWVEDVMSKKKFNHRIMITDKDMVSEKSGKQQWVNQLGMSTWVDDEKNLPQWFTHLCNKEKEPIAELSYRTAKMGEADFYEFLRNWGAKIDWYNAATNVLLDTKKLFRGKVDEVNDLVIATDEDKVVGTVVLLATVYIKEAEDGPKKYQNIAKHYLPGWKMKNVRLMCTNKSWDSADKQLKRFKDSIMDTEYGVKEEYVFDLLQDWDESTSLAASNDTIRHSSDTAAPTDTEY